MGGVTVGSLESGPLVGVVAANAHGVGVPDGHLAGVVPVLDEAAVEELAVPAVDVVELFEPQPVISTAATRVTTPKPTRERMVKTRTPTRGTAAKL